MLTKAGLEEKLPASPEKPDTGDPEPMEFPDQGVLPEPDNWRRKLQRLLQHSDIMELKQRLDTGACAPPPRKLFTHIKKQFPPVKRPPLPAEKSSFYFNDSTRQLLASYSATSQMPGINLNPDTSSSPTPRSRKSRTGLKLKNYEVDRIASLGGEQKVTKRERWNKAGLRRDEPPQGKLAEDADAVRKKRVLIEVTRPCSILPVGGTGCPEHYGWWDRGKPPSAVRLYSGHEPEDNGNKVKRHSCRLLLDNATLMPSPKITESPHEATPQTSPPRAEELAHDYSTYVFLLQWDLFVTMRRGPTIITSGQGSQLTASHDSAKAKSLNWEQTSGVQWKSNIAASQAEASKATFWRMLFERLRGDDSILSHVEYYTALATAANVAYGQHIALRLHAGTASGAALEP